MAIVVIGLQWLRNMRMREQDEEKRRKKEIRPHPISIRATRVSPAASIAQMAININGPETHGKFMSDCLIEEPSALVRSEAGKKAQSRVWDELMKKLEAIKPGVTKIL
ncbi:uncharacterized protein BDZ99DRAFT_462022 [Mytilinidion resinicola]|uniref:Uncharacterized protein n=1 Tax=Mytilinidion resinicola TaxID=574789 RepID=A0A6A6YQ53_9PEZI|nr:uncharacterized protein BDZ99DRAFT_462022 [Mytilinidion resinicola]KAF2810668.1 hypothetical protein BDZ99DRAFT_462022 [Mytilinidion resinicola]